jgi:D-cysteine desulfhydrase/L-cysteate sulfo-lyase
MSHHTADLGCLDDLPRAVLWAAPTPLEPMENLRRGLSSGPLYVKRDDCMGLAFGGNKVRQLEFYLGAAQDQDADTILITGAVQSNFVRLAAAAARKLSMDCHIQLEERVPKTDPLYRNSGNVLLDRLLGATLHSYPDGEDEAGDPAQLSRR